MRAILVSRVVGGTDDMSTEPLKNQLLELEAALQRREVRADAARLRELLSEDFFELGVSGITWTREAVIAALGQEAFSPRHIHDFQLKRLAEGVALVSYRCHREATPERPQAHSLRSSIWQWRERRWQMVFHQGTPLQGPLTDPGDQIGCR